MLRNTTATTDAATALRRELGYLSEEEVCELLGVTLARFAKAPDPRRRTTSSVNEKFINASKSTPGLSAVASLGRARRPRERAPKTTRAAGERLIGAKQQHRER